MHYKRKKLIFLYVVTYLLHDDVTGWKDYVGLING